MQPRPLRPSGASIRRTCTALLLLSSLAACQGELGDPAGAGPNGSGAGTSSGAAPGGAGTAGTATGGSGGTPSPSDCVTPGTDTGANVLRRLSTLEYQLSLQDLFQLPTPPSVEGIPEDTGREGFKTFAEVQTMSAQHVRAYLDQAKKLADALLADAPRRSAVIGCEPTANECLGSFVTRFGRLAYRRPLEAVEVDGIVSQAREVGLDTTDQLRYAIEVLLTAPSFLYRVEIGATPEGLTPLAPAEVAAKLSFALWGRAPSSALLDEAVAGALDAPGALGERARAMLADPRAHGFFAAFFRQWLGFDAMRAPTQPPMGWTDALLPAMQSETDRVLADFAFGDARFLDVLTTNRTRLSPELATFYGLPAPAADGSVEFPAGHARANTGLLTHASLLSAKSDGDPIAIRGTWLRRVFLCETVHAPASLADMIGELLVGLTRVQIVQRRNMEGACKGCHALIDPIGVGFAQFDGTGRFDAALDPSVFGIVPGLPGAADPAFASLAELSAKLAATPKVAECMATKAFIYVNGREPAPADACSLASASQAFAGSNFDFTTMLAGLIEAPEFRLRRAPAGAP